MVGKWVRADRLVADGPTWSRGEASRRRDERLAEATELSRDAAAIPRKENGSLGSEAVRRHLLAAEIRRTFGDPAAAVENYVILTRHQMAKKDRTSAIALMRKALACADLSPCTAARQKAYLLAASVYHFVGRPLTAGRMLAELGDAAAAHPPDATSPYALSEVVDTIAAATESMTVEPRICTCIKGKAYLECCGIADTYPAEFKVRVESSGHASDAGQWRYDAQSMLGALMRDQGRSHGARHWVKWEISRSRHELKAFPNWSGHALEAARTMATVSRLNPDGTAGPASAVFQAVCAVEAFLNTVEFAMKQDGSVPWGDPVGVPDRTVDEASTPVASSVGCAGSTDTGSTGVPGRRGRKPKGGRSSRDGHGMAWRYRQIWKDLFGVDYEERRLPTDRPDGNGEFPLSWDTCGEGTPRLDGLRSLLDVRNMLTHANSEMIETIMPERTSVRTVLPGVPETVRFRHGPVPILEKVLTPSFAEWAAELAHDLIRAVRYEWRHRSEAESVDERFDDVAA